MNFLGEIALSLACLAGLTQRVEHVSIDQALERVEQTLQQAIAQVDQTLARSGSDHCLNPGQLAQLREDLRINLRSNVTSNNLIDVIYVDEALKNTLSLLLLGANNKDNHNSLISGNMENTLENSRAFTQLSDLFYLKSAQQPDSWSCGYWALANAKVLGEVLFAGQAIDAQEIAQRATQFYKDLNVNQAHLLSSDEIIELLTNFNILNFHVLERRHEHYGVLPDYLEPFILQNRELYEQRMEIPQLIALQDEQELRDQQIGLAEVVRNNFFIRLKQYHLNNIRPEQPQLINFFCNLGGAHWILISIVKPINRQPILLILDSANWKVRSDSADYIKTLHKYFIERPDLRSISASENI